jgi:hypothetical protein
MSLARASMSSLSASRSQLEDEERAETLRGTEVMVVY